MSANFCPALALLEHHCVPIVGRNLGYPVTGVNRRLLRMAIIQLRWWEGMSWQAGLTHLEGQVRRVVVPIPK